MIGSVALWRRSVAAVLGALVVSCLWRQVDAPAPLRPTTADCRPAVQVDGRLVCGDGSLAALQTLCPSLAPGDGDAVALAGGCTAGRMPGEELLALGVKLDVNTASADELEALPGIGPTLAQRIVAGRPYRTVADLDRVSGIGPARMAALRDFVRVGIPESRRALP